MKRQNRKRGFTMAEMLIVVAIIGVLGAVAFVAVNQHQRSLERLERDSVAREIFIAAQNHLTMAESQGYLGLTGEDIYGRADATAGVYYFAVNNNKDTGDSFSTTAAPETLLDLMLPFGSIDETVRGGGSYIIRYQPKSETETEIMPNGIIMDVFYCSTDDRYGYDLSGVNKENLAKMIKDYGEDKESARRNFEGKVLGWYGGEEAETLSKAEIYAPLIVVENADKLRIGIKEGKGKNGESNPNTSSLKVIVTSTRDKEIKKEFILKSDKTVPADDRVKKQNISIGEIDCSFEIVLDDITTAGMHFADLVGIKKGINTYFEPGEDIIIQAVAFDNTQISNIAYSAEVTVNSLFEKVEAGDRDNAGNIPVTAYVNNIRHLENLDKRVSNVSVTWEEGTAPNKTTYNLNSAVQTSDISWREFKKAINGDNADTTVIYEHKPSTDDTAITTAGNYLPVRTAIGTGSSYLTSYDGQYHSISDIKVDYAGNAGLFESITGVIATQATITNLALIDFDVSNSGSGNINAGALAGTLTYVDVTNVIAYNSKATITAGIVAASGNAGGLIGYASACNVTKSAASVYVTATAGNAGGLIGETNDGKVSGCYSGGHTNKGTYYKDDGTEIYNVQAAAKNAGGLVGVASGTPIDYSYATCSVTGETAGGFVASASATISDCYAVGMVKGTGTTGTGTAAVNKEGAFDYGATTISNCRYLEIMNERPDNAQYPYLPALGDKPTDTNVKQIDESADTYNIFCGAAKDNNGNDLWKPASPYDAKLIEYYGGRFNLQTVAQLDTGSKVGVKEVATTVGNVTTPADFVATHYGDWPAPEIFVVNTQTN